MYLCRRCGYILDHLPSQRCPECGSSFNLTDPRTYHLDDALKKRRRIRRVAGMSVLFLLGASILVLKGVATEYRATERQSQVCLRCGCTRTRTVTSVAGIPYAWANLRAQTTPLSFWLGDTQTCQHDWHTTYGWRVDSNGVGSGVIYDADRVYVDLAVPQNAGGELMHRVRSQFTEEERTKLVRDILVGANRDLARHRLYTLDSLVGWNIGLDDAQAQIVIKLFTSRLRGDGNNVANEEP